MKKTLTTLGLGACAIVALSSCQSTDGDGFGGYEEAMPVSEAVVGEGQLPPWLLEDSGEEQVAAGSYTDHAIPEPGETLADAGGSASSRQNQPAIADNSEDVIESAPGDVVAGPDESLLAVNTPPVIAPTPGGATVTPKPETKPKTPSARKPVVTNKGTKLSKRDRKKVMRVTEPTLVSYKVQKGDSLSEIAKRSGTTVAAIRKASGIKGDTIYAGSTIKVPYTPKAYRAAQAAKAAAQAAKPRKYTVRRGDTISAIASKNGLTVAQVLKANGMSQAQAKRIRPGQTLTIPGKVAKKSTTKQAKRRSRR